MYCPWKRQEKSEKDRMGEVRWEEKRKIKRGMEAEGSSLAWRGFPSWNKHAGLSSLQAGD